MKVPLFPVGQFVATPAALERLAQAGVHSGDLLDRHVAGDWGDLSQHDKDLNDQALAEGTRLLSAYDLPNDTTIWIITEADRSATTVLCPEDY